MTWSAKQLRELLFSQCEMDSLFGLQNERFIFDGVDHRQKVCIFSFRKGGSTFAFPAAFRITTKEAIYPKTSKRFLMHQVSTLFLQCHHSTTVSGFTFPDGVQKRPRHQNALKLSRFPSLGVRPEGSWSCRFRTELHMTNDRRSFQDSDGSGRLPLYEGKMIHQFDHLFCKPKYWLKMNARLASGLLGKQADVGQQLEYQSYRLGFRVVASNTNARTAIMTVLPPNVFCPHTMPTAHISGAKSQQPDHRYELMFFACVNSLVVDSILRQRVTAHLTFFLLNQIPFPDITEADRRLGNCVRSARLVCTTPNSTIWPKIVGLKSHKDGATDRRT